MGRPDMSRSRALFPREAEASQAKVEPFPGIAMRFPRRDARDYCGAKSQCVVVVKNSSKTDGHGADLAWTSPQPTSDPCGRIHSKACMTKILRTWTFWIKTELTDECCGYLDQFVLPDLRRQIGSLRASSLFRDRSDGTTQVVVASVWESMERIRAYDGGGTSRPMIDASVREKILDRDAVMRYYAIDSLDDPALTDLTQVELGTSLVGQPEDSERSD